MVYKTTKNYSTIRQANAMIHGRQNIKLISKRLLLFSGNKINPAAENPNEIRISFEECAASVATRAANNWKNRKAMLDYITEDLSANPLIQEVTDKATGKRIYTRQYWIQSLVIDERTEEIVLVYTDVIRKYFMYLEGQPYTNTIDDSGQYRSSSTIRIKEIIEVELFKKRPYFDLPIETLKWQLGLEQKYANFGDFRRSILEATQKELKKAKSPIQFSFDILGRRGQVVKRGAYAIRFYPQFVSPSGEKQADTAATPTVGAVPKAPTPVHQEYLAQYPVVFKTLKGWGISTVNINQNIKQNGIEAVKAAMEVAAVMKQANNHAGVYISALKKGWETEKAAKQRLAQATKKRQSAIAQQAKAIEDAKKERAREATARDKRICDRLIAADKGLLEKARQQLIDRHRKNGTGTTLRSLPKIPADAYKSRRHRVQIMDEIKGLCREDFDFPLADWQRELPHQYREMLRRATAHYETKVRKPSHGAKEQQHGIASLMKQQFESLYGRRKSEG